MRLNDVLQTSVFAGTMAAGAFVTGYAIGGLINTNKVLMGKVMLVWSQARVLFNLIAFKKSEKASTMCFSFGASGFVADVMWIVAMRHFKLIGTLGTFIYTTNSLLLLGACINEGIKQKASESQKR